MRKHTVNARDISDKKLAELKKQATQVLSETRRVMMQRQPFTGAVAMNLDIVPIRDARCDTACTDGKRVFFDIDFLSGLTPEERLFVFAHEVWHCLLMHFARSEGRDHEIMNIATDLEVNQLLVKDGFCLPPRALMPSNMNVDPDLSAEAYYEALVRNAAEAKSSAGAMSKNGGANGQFDRHIWHGERPGAEPLPESDEGLAISDKYGKVGADPDFKPGDPKDGVERIREAAVAAAQVVERTRGSLPGHVKRLVEVLLKPEIDWREMLQQFVTRTCCGETRNWNPPNRRHVHGGVYLQSRKGEKIRVFVGLDVSGSTAGDIPKFLSELNGLVKSFGKYSLRVAQCDTEIGKCETYTDDEPLDLDNEKFNVVGGGGTALKPLLERAVEDDCDRPDAIVILTDGVVERFVEDDDPGVPVMWLVTKGGNTDFSEFGEVVEFKNAS